jgi:outer membrane protein OmpA-like peptidoglycan-associated protein
MIFKKKLLRRKVYKKMLHKITAQKIMPNIENITTKYLFSCLLLLVGWLNPLAAQDSLTIEAYLYEDMGAGYIRGVSVKVEMENAAAVQLYGDEKGLLRLRVPRRDAYVFTAKKAGFEPLNKKITAAEATVDKGIWHIRLPMRRAMGYMLDASLTDFVEDKASGTTEAYGVEGATIEIYNNTLQREELRLVGHKAHNFSYFLEQGNEYVFMIRKKGYFTKRMRANVNVNGCILCMEGFGNITPGVADNLTKNNTVGVLVTTISLKKVTLNETVKIDNIYYDVARAELRADALKQLDKLAELLSDNPQVQIELTSHTDCRGPNDKNMKLSQARADGVVAYLTTVKKLPKTQISARGMGESKPLNSCIDGVECTEELHQANRRTEFTVIAISQNKGEEPSLASMMQQQNMDKILAATSEQIYIPTDENKGAHVWHSSIVRPTDKAAKAQLPQVVAADYTGVKIELFSDSQAPTIHEPAFLEFERTYLYLTAEGLYSILLGDFPTAAAAQNDLKQLQKTYREARVVLFEAGSSRE